MAVIRLTDYGAVGDGVTSDTAAFVAAIAACAAGDDLIIPKPPVAWRMRNVTVDKKLRIVGEGYQPLIQRADGSSSMWVLGTSDGLAFENLAMDCRASINSVQCVAGTGFSNVRVSDCYMFSSDVPQDAWTVCGPLIRAGSNIVIDRNRLLNLQIKVGGPSASAIDNGPAVRVTNNYSDNAHNFGCSYVSAKDTGAVRDGLISGNTFLNTYAGGIYVGADGDLDDGTELYRVTITGNVISNDRPLQGLGIIVRAGLVCEDVDVSHNTVFPSPNLGVNRYGAGIDIKSTDFIGEGFMRRVTVVGNRVSKADLWGIRIIPAGGEIVVMGNQTYDDRGILIDCKEDTALKIALVGNLSFPRSTHPGIKLNARAGTTIDASAGLHQLGNALQIVEVDPGSVTLESSQGQVSFDVTMDSVALVVDQAAYPLEEGVDFGTHVNAILAALPSGSYHSIKLRGEHTTPTRITFQDFSGGLDIDAHGLRMVYTGTGQPMEFVNVAGALMIGGRFRRTGESFDRKLTFAAATEPSALQVRRSHFTIEEPA